MIRNSASPRLHIFGASGSGTTSLGRALAVTLQVPHVDGDDCYWEATDPPYCRKRSDAAREAELLRQLGQGGWVLSGSIVGWGDLLIPQMTLAIFISLARDVRLQRLVAREEARFGPRIAVGGDMHQIFHDFMAWAGAYDFGALTMRSRALHEEWMNLLSCPVLRVDGLLTTAEQVRLVQEAVLNQLNLVEKS